MVDDDTGPETPTLDKGVTTQPTYPAPYDRGSETTYSSHVYILYMLDNMHILSVVYACMYTLNHTHAYTCIIYIIAYTKHTVYLYTTICTKGVIIMIISRV